METTIDHQDQCSEPLPSPPTNNDNNDDKNNETKTDQFPDPRPQPLVDHGIGDRENDDDHNNNETIDVALKTGQGNSDRARVLSEPPNSCGQKEEDDEEEEAEKDDQKKKKTAIDGPNPRGRDLDDRDVGEEEEAEKDEKKGKKTRVIDGPYPAPDIPDAMREKIEADGSGAFEMVMQKQLYESDVSSNQNRLSVPIRQLENLEFLKKDEVEAAKRRDDGNGKRVVGIQGVRLMDPNRVYHRVDFKRWDFKNSRSYVITGEWSKVVVDNDFKKGDILQLWFFRDRQDKPCFAVTTLPSSSSSSSPSSSSSS